MIRRFIIALVACYVLLAAMNVGHYRMQRTTTIDGQRYRISSIQLDGVTAQYIGGFGRRGESISLTANPPLWGYVSNTRVILPNIVAQRVYTLSIPGEESVHRTVVPVLGGEGEVTYSGNLARELFHWLIDQYHANRTFNSYARNLFLSAAFVPLGLFLLCFPSHLRKWADSHMHAEYDAPASRDKWFRLLGGVVVATVFFFNTLMFF